MNSIKYCPKEVFYLSEDLKNIGFEEPFQLQPPTAALNIVPLSALNPLINSIDLA
jgi:hypothetical protein